MGPSKALSITHVAPLLLLLLLQLAPAPAKARDIGLPLLAKDVEGAGAAP